MVAQRRTLARTDADLKRVVLDEFRFDPRMQDSYSQTAVLASEGVVTLAGRVHSFAQKLAAEDATLRLRGVRWIVNDLEVIPTLEEEKPDGELEAAVRSVLAWNSFLRGTSIRAIVENGWVFLEGSVPCAFQREVAEREAGQLTGVRGLTNEINIEVKPVAADTIIFYITEALRRNALVDRLRIDVLASGDEVILRGNVKTWAECQEAARMAWSSPGVRMVDNQLTVGDGPI